MQHSFSARLCATQKAVLICLAFSFLFTFGTPCLADCTKCGLYRVMLFDTDVQVPRPQEAPNVPKWWDMFMVSAGVRSYLMNSDPTRGQVTFLNGMCVNEPGKLKFGLEYANLPPSAGLSNGYLIVSQVAGTPAAYTATVLLQVSATREVVAQTSTTFDNNANTLDVGSTLGMQLGPLADKIREFEKKKRASGPPYALCPTLDVKASASTLQPLKTTAVEFQLKDCDGETAAMSNRKIEVEASCGELSAKEVVTDGNGKAKLIFTSGDKPCNAVIFGSHRFSRADESENSATGKAIVRVNKPPEEPWSMRIDYLREVKSDSDDRLQGKMVGEKKDDYQRTTEFSITGVVNRLTGQRACSVVFGKDYCKGMSPTDMKKLMDRVVFAAEGPPEQLDVQGRDCSFERYSNVEQIEGRTVLLVRTMTNDEAHPDPAMGKTRGSKIVFLLPEGRFKGNRSFHLGELSTRGISRVRGTECLGGKCKDVSQDSELEGDIPISFWGVPDEKVVKQEKTSSEDGVEETFKSESEAAQMGSMLIFSRTVETRRKKDRSSGIMRERSSTDERELLVITLRPAGL